MDSSNGAGATVLLVDDEANILSALKRVLRPRGYCVFTVGGGEEGLQIMQREAVDLVISDMRMPHMDGARFLGEVRGRWPETVRILLTGYSDLTSTVAAVNQGEIYRYISKPWEDEDVALVVRQGLERQALEREKRDLEALTARQNAELRDLNATLEAKVQERTDTLRKALSSLEAVHDKLKSAFFTSIQVFSNLMEMRAGTMAVHSRRVAEHARGLAQQLGLPAVEVQDVFVAGLLHEIGKLAMPDALLHKPEAALSAEERQALRTLPLRSEAALMPLEQLRGAARLVRSHCERYDGLGYPDGASGMNIALGARILAVANDYDELQQGWRTGKPVKAVDALAALLESKGKRYDPQAVDAFVQLLVASDVAGRFHEVPIHAAQLVEGMVLTRDVCVRDGLLLVARERVLDVHLIAQLRAFEKGDGERLGIYVRYRQD